MATKANRDPSLRREVTGHTGGSFEDRLKRSQAFDLRTNAIFTDLGNGYLSVEPINEDKRWNDDSLDLKLRSGEKDLG